MKVHEYQAKEIFSQYGIPVERHVLCNTPDEAVKAFRQLEVDKVVVKAQVLTGGRGKAGGIKLANNEELVRQHCPGNSENDHQRFSCNPNFNQRSCRYRS